MAADLEGDFRQLSMHIVGERTEPKRREVEIKAVVCLDVFSQRKDYSVNSGLKAKKTKPCQVVILDGKEGYKSPVTADFPPIFPPVIPCQVVLSHSLQSHCMEALRTQWLWRDGIETLNIWV